MLPPCKSVNILFLIQFEYLVRFCLILSCEIKTVISRVERFSPKCYLTQGLWKSSGFSELMHHLTMSNSNLCICQINAATLSFESDAVRLRF